MSRIETCSICCHPNEYMVETLQLAIPGLGFRNKISAAWWAVISRFLLHGLIVSTWVSRIPAVQNALDLSSARLGMCLLGTAIGSVCAIPVTGWLITRFGTKRVTTWSTVGFSVALAAPAFATSATSLFVALVLFGAMAGSNDVAINAQGVAVESALAKPSMSRFHALFSIGGMIGASVGGLFAAWQINPDIHMAIAAAVFLVMGALTGPFLLDEDQTRTTSSEKMAVRRIPLTLLTLATVAFCMFLSEGAIADWTGVYLRTGLHSTPGLAAAGYAVFSAGMAAFRLLGDSITSRLGPVRTMRSGAVIAAAGLTIALLSTSPLIALPGFALAGAGFSVIVPLVFRAGAKVTSVPRGAGVATVSGSGYIGFLFGPPLIGLIAQAASLQIALFGIVALSLVAAALANVVSTDSRV
ncbi:MAG: MFS transporter [Bryobacteraceae bacterium]